MKVRVQRRRALPLLSRSQNKAAVIAIIQREKLDLTSLSCLLIFPVTFSPPVVNQKNHGRWRLELRPQGTNVEPNESRISATCVCQVSSTSTLTPFPFALRFGHPPVPTGIMRPLIGNVIQAWLLGSSAFA